ncbi:MAG: response regulator [Verrucomicrobia bacterium]|nr:response regulator [Verrucomicrobiota bacterium]
MKSVLLIDEDRDFRTTLRTWLTGDGWHVLESDEGEAGFKLIRQHRPELVICDLLMPRCNGFRLCRLVHQQPQLAQTKIIISSGRGYPGDRLNALEAGADEYLVKPVQRMELARLLKRLALPKRPAGAPAPNPKTSPQSRDPLAPLKLHSSPSSHNQPTKVKFWGVRGSIPTPGESTVLYGGNTSCVEVRADGEIIILDAGSGIRPLGLALMNEFKNQPINATLLISHTHWDHIQGFPFFIPAYNPKNNLRIRGFEGSSEGLQATLSSQMESPYFPVSMRQMPGHISVEEIQDLDFHIGKVRVKASFANHPGICVGYRLFTSCGSVVYLPDNEPYARLRGSPDATDTTFSESLTYARKQDEKLVEFIKATDVLIIDSQYDDAEYKSHVGWGHGCLDDVVTLALVAGVKKLFLFHHDPGHDDAQISRMVDWARKLVAMHGESLVVEAAREGSEVVLKPVTVRFR